MHSPYCLGNKTVWESDDARMVKTMEVNYVAHIWIIKAFLPEMLKRNDGHLVSIASVAGLIATPGMVNYAASKHAAVALLAGLRLELAKAGHTGIHTSTMMPAHIDTKLFEGFATSPLSPTLSPEYVAEMTVTAVERNEVCPAIP